MDVLCFGLSHQTAGVALRERFAIAEHELGEAARRLGTMEGVAEAVIVSTCNRVEFYAASKEPSLAFSALRQFVSERSASDMAEVAAFYQSSTGSCARHLFRVVCGLESMVLGETEILGQVKKAYSAATSHGSTARHLNKLFQRAFRVAKEVRTHTNITRGSVSVGSVAVDLAEKIFGQLGSCKVMILGAGETSEQTARALLSRGAKSIIVSNRNYERAAVLAAELGGAAIHFDHWDKQFDDIDILVSSTAAPHAIVTREKLAPVMQARRNRPLFVIDLAVPRDVESAINELEGVYLYDIDSLRTLSERSLALRRQDIELCESMIERHVEEFSDWLAGKRSRGVSVDAMPLAAPVSES
ncbi:MAG: glutamyl-tRNA reductase [Chthoniobacter sp.]|jgi:glutamyl-tRNA reductase|nr:glutamyl-tRNA reductase [Chthoniobacter sp.]